MYELQTAKQNNSSLLRSSLMFRLSYYDGYTPLSPTSPFLSTHVCACLPNRYFNQGGYYELQSVLLHC